MMMGAMMYIKATIRPAVTAGGPGSWGFEGPEAMQSRVRENSLLVKTEMMESATAVDGPGS